MKSLVIFAFIIAFAAAQRPSFAGTQQKVYPELGSRFRDTANSNSQNSATISNRGGVVDEPKSTERLPVDARGDSDLVQRLNSWPRENRPYWLLNADLIEKHRDPQGTILANRIKDQPKY